MIGGDKINIPSRIEPKETLANIQKRKRIIKLGTNSKDRRMDAQV